MTTNNYSDYLPFHLDASYKGDEDTQRVIQILKLEGPQGWSIVDRDGDLALVHYNDGADMEKYGKLRGVLVDLAAGYVVADSFGYTPVIVAESISEDDGNIRVRRSADDDVSFDLSDAVIRPAFEGVVIRAVRHNGKTYRITHKKINPLRSRWGSSKTFLTMYEEAGGPTDEQLFDLSRPHSSTCYEFLVVDPSLCVASKKTVEKPYVVMIGARDFATPFDDVSRGRFDFPTSSEIETGKVHVPPSLSVREVISHLDDGEGDYRLGEGGSVIVSTEREGRIVSAHKIHSRSYEWRSRIRNDNPNVPNQFYCLLPTAHKDVSDDDAWKVFCDRYLLFGKSRGQLSSKDSRIETVGLNLLHSLPEEQKPLYKNLIRDYFEDREAVIKWIERKCKYPASLEESSEAIRDLVRLIRYRADTNQKKNGVPSDKSYYSFARSLLLREQGRTLYSFVREMRREK